MQKNIEVELRALLEDGRAFEEKLKAQGAEFRATSHLTDIYFCDRVATTFEDIAMHDVGSYSLRLRRALEGANETITLNTKTITTTGDHQAWEEHEVTVNDYSETAHLLQATEFKPFFKFEKTRRTYAYQDMEIAVEDIVDFGTAVEVEIIALPGEEAASKQKIREFLLSVDIAEEAILPKSVTSMIMHKLAFKQEITVEA
jgi:predicted adenylyl cyclase CyaB